MHIKSPDPAKLRQVLDTVFGVNGVITKDGVEIPDEEDSDLMVWLGVDWPDLVTSVTPLVTEAELDLLGP